jgi:hypothetical protein
MGRHSRPTLDFGEKLYLRRVHLNSGGYDTGGAYWGHGMPLFVAMDCEGHCYFLRARNRNAAKAEILALDYSAIFYR